MVRTTCHPSTDRHERKRYQEGNPAYHDNLQSRDTTTYVGALDTEVGAMLTTPPASHKKGRTIYRGDTYYWRLWVTHHTMDAFCRTS